MQTPKKPKQIGVLATPRFKYTGKSQKYKHVHRYENEIGEVRWVMKITKSDLRAASKFYITEKEAARNADICLIRHGKKPVNILKSA